LVLPAVEISPLSNARRGDGLGNTCNGCGLKLITTFLLAVKKAERALSGGMT
jgi:hypothetical protein